MSTDGMAGGVGRCLFACALPGALAFPLALLHGADALRRLSWWASGDAPASGAWRLAQVAAWPEAALGAGLAVAALVMLGWRPRSPGSWAVVWLASAGCGLAVRWVWCVGPQYFGDLSGDAEFAAVLVAGVVGGLFWLVGLPSGALIGLFRRDGASLAPWLLGCLPAAALGIAFMLGVWFPFTDRWGLGADGPAQAVALDGLFFSWGAGVGAYCAGLAAGRQRSRLPAKGCAV